MTANKFFYASGPAGCGKTHAAINVSTSEAAQGNRVKVVQPSIALIGQTESNLQEHLGGKWWGKAVSVKAIHGPKDGTPPKDSVFKRYVDHVEADVTGGEVLLVTNETFKKKGRLKRPDWQLIKDEESSVIETVKVNMATTHVLVTPHMELKEVFPGSKHAFVKAKRGHKKALETLRDNPRKEPALDAFKELLTAVLDPNCRVMITFEIWKALLDGSKESDTTEFCVLIGPAIYAGYSSATVMCALFEHTMQHRLWSNPVFGAEWVENGAFKRHMRNQTGAHRNSAQWTILGAYEAPWYDNSKDNLHENGQTHLELFASAAANHFSGAPYAFCANKDDTPLPEIKHHFIKGHTNRVPNMPQGLNELYEGYEKAVLFGSYNYSPFVSGCLEAIGITREEQEVARNFLTWYQQMLRIKGRDDTEPGSFTVIAPTTRFGSWLVCEGIMPHAMTGRLKETLVPLAPQQPQGRPTIYTDDERKLRKSVRNKKDYQRRKERNEQSGNDRG